MVQHSSKVKAWIQCNMDMNMDVQSSKDAHKAVLLSTMLSNNSHKSITKVSTAVLCTAASLINAEIS